MVINNLFNVWFDIHCQWYIRDVAFNIRLTKDEKRHALSHANFLHLSELGGTPSKRTSFAIHHANAFFRIDQ